MPHMPNRVPRVYSLLLYLLMLLSLLTPRGDRSPAYSPICPVGMLIHQPLLGTEMGVEVAQTPQLPPRTLFSSPSAGVMSSQ